MFRITDGKGFGIKFANGYTVSVQFGPGNYCENYHAKIGQEEKDCGRKGSIDAETAVISPQGELIETPYSNGDTVSPRNTPDKVLELLNWAANLPAASPPAA